MTSQPAIEQTDWAQLRANTIGQETGRLYADWTASGQLYRPIEQRLTEIAGPMMANTHTEDSQTGRFMTQAMADAETIVKSHVNAAADDVVLMAGTGMTGALAKLIRILGLWVHEQHRDRILNDLESRPVVYVTHMEHHSNHTLWLETLAEVRLIPANDHGDVDLDWLEESLTALDPHRTVFASVTAASNVTGLAAPYRAIAKLIHRAGGHCFVDFACAAPYVDIDMHPPGEEHLDAIFFSPHKFLGGPGASGVLVFSSALYQNQVPDQPGGGTVLWTNPWGEHRFLEDIAVRESGGTPGILQNLKAAMAMQLKESIGTEAIAHKERILNAHFTKGLDRIKGVQLLAGDLRQRLSVFSLVFDDLGYDRAVQHLSDDFGIEARGGCACAGTYGHHLLNIDYCTSHSITDRLDRGELNAKPGWVRLSFHPMMTLDEVDRTLAAIEQLAAKPQKAQSTQPMDTSVLWGDWL